MFFNAQEPAFPRPYSKDDYGDSPINRDAQEGLTKEEYIKIHTFFAMCQNPVLVQSLAQMLHPSQLKQELVKQSMALADDFINAMNAPIKEESKTSIIK